MVITWHNVFYVDFWDFFCVYLGLEAARGKTAKHDRLRGRFVEGSPITTGPILCNRVMNGHNSKGGVCRYCGREGRTRHKKAARCVVFVCQAWNELHDRENLRATKSSQGVVANNGPAEKTLAAIPLAFRGTIVVAPVTGASVADAAAARWSRPWSCSGTGTTPRWTVTVTIAGKVPVLPLKFGRILELQQRDFWLDKSEKTMNQNQSINQSINWPIHESISQSINQSINRSVFRKNHNHHSNKYRISQVFLWTKLNENP